MTRLKTVEFHIPTLAALPDNTLTAMQQITLYVPEVDNVVTWKSCVINVSFKQLSGHVLGNINSRQIDVSVNGAAATSYINANLYTASGENICLFHGANCTDHFTSNWTENPTATLDISVLIDDASATPVWGGVDATIYLTYEYDDTSTTQIKTVYIPLDAPVGAFGTSKPGTPTATIAALDTDLPEYSKVIRSMYIVCQGNTGITATTDYIVNMQIDTYTAFASPTLEGGLASAKWERNIASLLYYDGTPSVQGIGMDTSASHGFYLWANIAKLNHQQVYMVVTYEFDAYDTNDVFVSVMLPMKIDAQMGMAASDFQRGLSELWIEEENISVKQIACYAFWDQSNVLSSLNMRIGTGDFVTYTDSAATVCGSVGCMVRNDNATILARGKNLFNYDVYLTPTNAIWGWAVNGFWIINYIGNKPVAGYGAANHTVRWNFIAPYSGTSIATQTKTTTSAIAPEIPETEYWLSNAGTSYTYYTDAAGSVTYLQVSIENTADESGVQWIPVFLNASVPDSETGLHSVFADCSLYLKREPNDPTNCDIIKAACLDIETPRRWDVLHLGGSIWESLDMWFTYHTNMYEVAGNITQSAGGTINIQVWDNVTKELRATTTIVGDGAYSVLIYDSAHDIFVEALEDSTHIGRSNTGEAE
jgi:hypothetical protein